MAGVSEGDTFTSVLAERPDLGEPLEALDAAAWSVVDPVLLELCRIRIAMLLGCAVEQRLRSDAARAAGLGEATIAELAAWPTSERFGPRERACLAFCEQFVIDVAGMSDNIARAVSDELGPKGFRNFVSGLLVVEQRQRLRLAWERLLEPETAR
jgi:alkylhydroperoxidase family enzyme